MTRHLTLDRRSALGFMAAGAVAWTTPGAFADRLSLTPKQTEGPFYPDKLPLDTDNDLIILNDQLTPAVGTITHLGGRVLDASGVPMRNAVVEIWQCDAEGRYHHPKGASGNKRDKNFQGYGRFLTDREGGYYFRTIKPVPYPGRTPHIHMIVRQGDKRLLTTQLYMKDEPLNKKDGVFQRVPDAQKPLLLTNFKPIAESETGELLANFNLVVGRTPEG